MIRYVYVSGPYTNRCPNHNVHAAIEVADALARMGFVPFVPHLSHLWDTVSPHDYEFWMAHDLAWVERCDALFRIPGKSAGADREVAHARSLGKQVFESMQALDYYRALMQPFPSRDAAPSSEIQAHSAEGLSS